MFKQGIFILHPKIVNFCSILANSCSLDVRSYSVTKSNQHKIKNVFWRRWSGPFSRIFFVHQLRLLIACSFENFGVFCPLWITLVISVAFTTKNNNWFWLLQYKTILTLLEWRSLCLNVLLRECVWKGDLSFNRIVCCVNVLSLTIDSFMCGFLGEESRRI